MEISNFFKHLLRHKWTLILVPLATAAVTFFIVRKLPDVYRSHARLATGLADQSDVIRYSNGKQESQVNQEFNNLIQTILLKKMLNQVSYSLILHDLTKPVPFRQPSKLIESLTPDQKNQAIAIYTDKYNTREDLVLTDNVEKKLYKILESMDYDPDAIQKKLSVYRLNNSDFIDMLFDSDNPQLSAFVPNTLSREFITYYTSVVKENNTIAVTLLDSLLRQKEDTLRLKMLKARDYKIRNGILDVNDQAGALISQISDFETKRQEARKNIIAYSGALQSLNTKFSPEEQKQLENARLNQEIVSTRNRLNTLNNEYIKNNLNPSYKPKIDSLQNALSSQIAQTSTDAMENSVAAKKSLAQQKLDLEVALQLAENSVSSLDEAVGSLTGRLHALVPNQAVLQTLQEDIDANSKERDELQKKFNDARMEASYALKLRQVETAMPGELQPSKKMLLVALAAITSFVFCLVILFVFFYLDRSIRDARQLANITGIPVIGQLNKLHDKMLNLEELWNKNNTSSKSIKKFKTQLRSIRFEVDNFLQSSKIIAITSLSGNEGKTFFALNLAYAYGMINKKVLIIDGNFEDAEITSITQPHLFVEDFLHKQNEENVYEQRNPAVLGNRGEDVSLLEINDQVSLRTRLGTLNDNYDIILLEIPSLNAHNKAKEWISFADKVIAVYANGRSLDDSKKENITYLKSLNGKLLGWVFNMVKEKKNQKV